MSSLLSEKIKEELELKYRIDFKELNIIANSIRSKYFINEELKLLFNSYFGDNENLISERCLHRHKYIEQKEYSYISDNELYKKIEYAYELFYILSDIMNLEILWNKEITNKFDEDCKFLIFVANIYLMETENLMNEIKEYEMRKIKK